MFLATHDMIALGVSCKSISRANSHCCWDAKELPAHEKGGAAEVWRIAPARSRHHTKHNHLKVWAPNQDMT